MTIRYFRFEGLLLQQQWLAPAYVGIDLEGKVTYLSSQPLPEGSAIEAINGYAVPGFQNTHSHAFQYAMAGLAETHQAGTDDDFWTWREEMYKCALLVNPDEAEAIAAMLYSEMVRHGYSNVAEFHYLHHDKDGSPYSNLAEMGERMIAAAGTAGIKITLIPVFYQKGGFGIEPQQRQRRFISKTIDDYFKLFEATNQVVKKHNHASIGVSVHSLRAVDLKDIVKTVDLAQRELPFHIHVAEQKKEISDCLDYCGKRSMQWVIDNLPLSERFNLVHSTHLDDNELNSLAASKASVVLCPSTEGNLGDGIFRMKEYCKLGGHWSIGTDSHIGINPIEEFRMIDYRQRLVTNKRNTFAGDGARYMINESIASGRRGMGQNQKDNFAVGQAFDAVIIDASFQLIQSSQLHNLLTSFVYSGDSSAILGTMINGKWIVKENHHHDRQAIRQKFREVINKIANR